MKTLETVWDSKRKDLTLKEGDVMCGLKVVKILPGKYITVKGADSSMIELEDSLMELKDVLRPLGIKEIATDNAVWINGKEFDGWGLMLSLYGTCNINCEKLKNITLVNGEGNQGLVNMFGGMIGINTLKRGVLENVNIRTNTISRNNNIFPVLKGKNEISCGELIVSMDKLPIGKLKSDGVRALGLTEKFLDSTGTESLCVNLNVGGNQFRTYAFKSENWAIDIK